MGLCFAKMAKSTWQGMKVVMKELMKGTAKETSKVRIHNDLANAAFYFKNIIVDKQKNGGEGITLDCMACATMLAFTWEAYLNFFGSELLRDSWNEMEELEVKETQVLEKLSMKPDWGKQPYNSVRTLTKIRNWLAHGKPVEKEVTKQVIKGVEKVTARKIDLSGDWKRLCTPIIVVRAHDDLDALFKELLQASGIALIETLSQGDGSISFMEVITVGKAESVAGKSKWVAS
jgi:hypothetical protein